MKVFNYVKYDSLENRCRLLNNENVIWYIFLFLVICNIFITFLQKKSLFDEDNLDLKQKIHNGSEMVAVASLILYIYFLKLSYNNLLYANSINDDSKKEEAYLIIIANLLFIIAGIISVYLENRGVVPIIPSV